MQVTMMGIKCSLEQDLILLQVYQQIHIVETTDNELTLFTTATANNTIFRWRVDPFNTGTTSGQQFQFTTLPAYVSPSAGGGGTILKRVNNLIRSSICI